MLPTSEFFSCYKKWVHQLQEIRAQLYESIRSVSQVNGAATEMDGTHLEMNGTVTEMVGTVTEMVGTVTEMDGTPLEMVGTVIEMAKPHVPSIFLIENSFV